MLTTMPCVNLEYPGAQFKHFHFDLIMNVTVYCGAHISVSYSNKQEDGLQHDITIFISDIYNILYYIGYMII